MDELFGTVIILNESAELVEASSQSKECYGDCCDNCDCYCERYCDDDGE